MSSTGSKPPFINCHTHTFTGDHVPRWLAKKFLPDPLYRLLSLRFIVGFFRWLDRFQGKIPFQPVYKKALAVRTGIHFFLNRIWPVQMLVGLFLTLQVIFILFDWMAALFPPEESKIVSLLNDARIWLSDRNLLIPLPNNWLKILMIVIVLLFVGWGRNFILFIFKKIWSFLGMMPGKQTKEMFRRYMNIGRYAFHKQQRRIFGQLQRQYPQGTGFVILPMDMEFMEMGSVKSTYRQQMEELAEIKQDFPDTVYPFVFADPRRMAAEPDYFQYSISDGKVKLEDCFVKKYITEHKFSGIKIYPALGYYVFDERLLPLWKYAADNQVPMLTHCIRGTIFYRGSKKKEWNRHPIFEQAIGDGEYEKLLLPEMSNVDFSVNFTHPLNYLCLLEEKLLRKVVAAGSDTTKELFGYTDDDTVLKYDLRDLKICFGHFGGDDEWKRFFEKDRDNFSSQLVTQPGKGIDFIRGTSGKESKGKLELAWKTADWYSIICSMMFQYPNVYADISYILHNETGCLPLLKHTLEISSGKLRERVLYGTDFYVVRNHKSDKNMLADMLAGLSEEEFDLIARKNPREYLYNHLHGKIPI